MACVHRHRHCAVDVDEDAPKLGIQLKVTSNTRSLITFNCKSIYQTGLNQITGARPLCLRSLHLRHVMSNCR